MPIVRAETSRAGTLHFRRTLRQLFARLRGAGLPERRPLPDARYVRNEFQLSLIRTALLIALCAGVSLAQPRLVALTFDDLPLAGEGNSATAEEAARVNHAILAALARHHAPAVAFVIEKTVEGIGVAPGRAILREWLDQGHELGNHTYSHPDLTKLTLEQFREEVIRGEASIGPLLAERGRRPRYLRFPYNHSGETREKRDAVAAFLVGRGYTVAVCTIDNMDWEFARAYNVALARADRDKAQKLEAAYLSYTADEIDYYSALHQRIFGHEIPHVMLQHANRLNAAVMDQVLDLFEKRDYRFVTLETAQADAAYRTPDAPSGFGPMWGYRWAAVLGIKVDGRLEPTLPAWIGEYGKTAE
jgi:peptidoglycan/xylan/chitin deacetylase (PgdA/CDA1 family)